MRIISGKHKGRKINAPANLPIRPTTDFAKEGLFNVINNYIDFTEVAILDLFAGTGSISYEFISRGCKEATTVELNSQCLEFMHKIKEQLVLDNFFIVKADVYSYLLRCHKTYDLIFADPPYEMKGVEDLPNIILKQKILKQKGLLVIEHALSHNFENHPCFFEHRNYGKVNFSIFKQTDIENI